MFKFDGQNVVDEYTTLVNPKCDIPYYITSLTGIDNHMVRNAPAFEEIADKILSFSHDTVFVAHSVNFDYNVIKQELKRFGRDWVRKKLCTVRLSRQLFPGLNSYSLGKLCSALGIPLTDRHRARGDAHATMLLFKELLEAKGAAPVFKKFLNARSQEATLPPALAKAVFEKLPSKAGVYYFKDAQGKIIYVGKAVNIKKRVLGHFYDKSTNEIELCKNTFDIDFELSGSELLALLIESNAIKQHYPFYNKAQKANLTQYALFSYEDRSGILHLAFNKLKAVSTPLATFYRQNDCRSCLEEICGTFTLCPKYCHLQEGVAHCSHYSIKHCEGICRGEESVESYNSRVKKAIAGLLGRFENFIFKLPGRVPEETAIVFIENGKYAGYGFVGNECTLGCFEDFEPFLARQKNTVETQSMVLSYLLKNIDTPKLYFEQHFSQSEFGQ